ncbi:MAG: cupredoxin domain-containing protein [Acidobacteria bacterium]|nr:cupredoxin domain-containing protein [Acidobacteriota bacterium]
MPLTRSVTIAACAAAGLLASYDRTSGAAPAQAPGPRVVEVVARRYEFVPSTIEVVEGERVRIVVTSGDGLHGFGIKQFKVSKEIPRGATVTVDFTANAAGEFPFLCTEFCGDGHEGMKGVLVVKARDAVTP